MIEANNVNLNLMKTFIVVAESKRLADAGEKLGYASSSISTSISTLENQLGVQLFTRKPLKLTEIGKEIYENARLGMRTVDFAVTIAQSKNDMNCAKISIGCPSHITEFYLMERIENAINDYPNMCISIDTESDSRELIEEIRQNKIDFAILDSVPADCKEELVIKELKKTKNIFISNEPIDIKDIKDIEIIPSNKDDFKMTIKDNYPVEDLKTILKFKQERNTPKDQKDIENIIKYLENNKI